MNTMNNLSVNELLSNIQELRFALTDALITLQRVYEYSVMSKGDVIRVEDSLLLAEQALAGTDNI